MAYGRDAHADNPYGLPELDIDVNIPDRRPRARKGGTYTLETDIRQPHTLGDLKEGSRVLVIQDYSPDNEPDMICEAIVDEISTAPGLPAIIYLDVDYERWRDRGEW